MGPPARRGAELKSWIHEIRGIAAHEEPDARTDGSPPLVFNFMTYSKNERVGKVMGFRQAGCVILDSPFEMGFCCPVDRNHGVTWSEYKAFIFCYGCNKDYPSVVCCADIDEATKVFLDIIEEVKSPQGVD